MVNSTAAAVAEVVRLALQAIIIDQSLRLLLLCNDDMHCILMANCSHRCKNFGSRVLTSCNEATTYTACVLEANTLGREQQCHGSSQFANSHQSRQKLLMFTQRSGLRHSNHDTLHSVRKFDMHCAICTLRFA